MSEKCTLCGEKIEETFLSKKAGTIVKIKSKDKNNLHYVCTDCQKKFPNPKDEVNKKLYS